VKCVGRRPSSVGRRLALLAAAAIAATPAAAQVVETREHRVRIVEVVRGLEHPWSLAFLPDGRWLVTERPGRLRVIAGGRLEPRPVEGLPRVDPQGQGGLLEVAAHPRFADNGWIYLTYAQKDERGRNGTELARGKLVGAPNAYRLTEVQVLLRLEPKDNSGLHFGSRIVFDRDGFLYVTFGDRGTMARAQRLDDLAGKIVRLTEDGKPAPGNPFANDSSARPEIFSLGHRNVQGAALHPMTGVLWAHEHGPQGGDELNVVKAGVNYGWPIITYGVNYVTGTKIGEGTEKPGLAQPVKYWTPSPALSGMAFYTGDKFPRWRGDALIGALRGQALIRVRLEGERFVEDEFMLRGQVPRIRDVRVGPDGLVYLLTDLPNGGILRLEPA
jgi:glucose/arabinose dehydrogenase